MSNSSVKPEQNVNNSSRLRCCICGLPGEIEYKEWDDENRRMNTGRHTVPCLGHNDIHPALWNLHPDFDKFERFRVRKAAETQKKSNKKG